ncbi:Smr protein [Bradyrhizobiaceae bacterium SG-6C]|nr:Smr protein [Bradyrhizobiaceae bacterium SG-6C]
MKRPRNLDPPPVSRRKRALTREEAELWESVAKQARPLRKRARPVKTAHEVVDETPEKTEPVLRLKSLLPVQKIPNPPPAPPPLAPLGRRERSKLSRGRKDIDARLDLHGMTQSRAHRVLRDFLHHAQDDGLSVVLIITGKGKSGSESERGVLRRQVPQWLSLPEFRGLVIGFNEAHIGHGGEGALYVRVRRAR